MVSDPFGLTDAKLISAAYNPEDIINRSDTMCRITAGLSAIQDRMTVIKDIFKMSLQAEDKVLLWETVKLLGAKAEDLNKLCDIIGAQVAAEAKKE